MWPYLHYLFHFGLPFLIAFIFYRKQWRKVYFLLLLTMIVDADHLLASPVWDANRCSIGFHPLHSYVAIFVYILMLFFQNPIRILAIGLLLHMATDFLDCLYSYTICPGCFSEAPAKWLIERIMSFFG